MTYSLTSMDSTGASGFEFQVSGRRQLASTLPNGEQRKAWHDQNGLIYTEAQRVAPGLVPIPSNRMVPRTKELEPNLAKRLRGTVSSVAPRSITCEIEAPSGVVTIALLPELFSEVPSFGQAFDLEMVEVDGFLRPQVLLVPFEEADDDLSRTLSDLLGR